MNEQPTTERTYFDYAATFPSIANFRKSLLENTSRENCIRQIERLYENCPLEEIINQSIERLLQQDASFTLKGNYNNLVLLDEADFELDIHCSFGKPKEFIGSVMYSHVQDIVFCPIIDVNSKYKIFQQRKTNDPTLLKESFYLESHIDEKQAPGKAIYIEKFKDILHIDKYKPLVSLVLKLKANPLAYSWEYDATTLKPNRIVLADTNIARLETSLKILGQIGNDSSVDVLNRFVTSAIHTVRWENARSMINLDYDNGLAILKDMALNETHEEVKRAALQSLSILNQ